MTVERSKRRCFLTLTFIVKSVSKNLLIRILKIENQLHLFRQVKRCSQKQINWETAIEFLKLCHLELTPTFAKVDQTKSKKWTRSARTFEENVVTEELRQKARRLTEHREEINEIYNKIPEKCPPLRFACILRTIVTLRKEQYLQLMNGHTLKKISRLGFSTTTTLISTNILRIYLHIGCPSFRSLPYAVVWTSLFYSQFHQCWYKQPLKWHTGN